MHASMLSREWPYLEPHGHILLRPCTAAAGASVYTMEQAAGGVYPGWSRRVPYTVWYQGQYIVGPGLIRDRVIRLGIVHNHESDEFRDISAKGLLPGKQLKTTKLPVFHTFSLFPRFWPDLS